MLACQFSQPVPCAEPAFASLTIRSAGGLETIEAHCQFHVARRADQARDRGEDIVAYKPIPQRPKASDLLRPVGLDGLQAAVIGETA